MKMVEPAPIKVIFGMVRYPVGCQPLVAPKVRPAMKCFCIRKNIKTGIAARIAAADTSCQLRRYWPFSAFNPAVMGWMSRPG